MMGCPPTKYVASSLDLVAWVNKEKDSYGSEQMQEVVRVKMEKMKTQPMKKLNQQLQLQVNKKMRM